MKIVATADLHGQLPPEGTIEDCDVLVIAGDICPDFAGEGYRSLDVGGAQQSKWLDTVFREWLERQPAKHVVAIAGNHDFIFEHPKLIPDLPWIYLRDVSVRIDGVEFYGVPWVPNLRAWAFYADHDEEETLWSSVPNCDVLISHGPPRGFLDKCPYSVGSLEFAKNVERIGAKEIICGHIHEGYGQEAADTWTQIHNVAYVDGGYVAGEQPPHVITL